MNKYKMIAYGLLLFFTQISSGEAAKLGTCPTPPFKLSSGNLEFSIPPLKFESAYFDTKGSVLRCVYKSSGLEQKEFMVFYVIYPNQYNYDSCHFNDKAEERTCTSASSHNPNDCVANCNPK